MRAFAYAVAILVAAGVAYTIATTNPEPAPQPQTETPTASLDSSAEVTTASMTLNVPEMHCPFACYPRVKENLEQQDEVMSVELAPQKEEGVIDNPQVIVSYRGGFDADRAITVLEKAGFGGSQLVE